MPELASRLQGRVGFDDSEPERRQPPQARGGARRGRRAGAGRWTGRGASRRKDPREIETIAEASRLTDEVYEEVLAAGLAGRPERDVARDAHAAIRERGGEPSFEAIVAAGPNGALPHAEPSEREIGAGELVVWDMGAIVDGYCSDCTRTFAAGERPDGDAGEAYALVEAAQAAGLEAIRSGIDGQRGRRGGARGDPRRRTRGPLRPRPRPRCGAGGPRGPAARQALRGRAGRATWSPSSPGCTCPGRSGSGSRTWSW